MDGGKRRPWGFARYLREAPARPVSHEGCVAPRRDSVPAPAREVSPTYRRPRNCEREPLFGRVALDDLVRHAAQVGSDYVGPQTQFPLTGRGNFDL